MSESVRPGGTYKTFGEQREVLSPAEQRFATSGSARIHGLCWPWIPA